MRLRDSINKIEDLLNYADELNQEVIAITEHETISNAIKVEEMYNKLKKKGSKLKVILGNEIYLCRDGLNKDNFVKGQDKYYHFILLAKNKEGHKQIRQLSSRAWKRSYMAGKMRRVPTYYSDLEEIIGENKGISGNTNEALSLVTGDYIGLLDNDDLLPAFSLYEVVKRINENPKAEFIYSDEDKLETKIGPRYGVFFKQRFFRYEALVFVCRFHVSSFLTLRNIVTMILYHNIVTLSRAFCIFSEKTVALIP